MGIDHLAIVGEDEYLHLGLEHRLGKATVYFKIQQQLQW